MRVPTVVAIVCASLPVGALSDSETPWERYLRVPSPAHAEGVSAATYSAPSGGSSRFEADLPVLENEVAAGEAESVKLVARLMRQFRSSAAISEALDAMLGRAVRANPTAYLEAIEEFDGCPGAEPMGDLFVDREDARAFEAVARKRALQTVRSDALQDKRDECIKVLAGDQ